ncbi:putative aminotransferase [Aspergillus karnatakaensis]|uniref:putative aminotransferase n=1 Tax=Aspergillus karnatakaensis TaxID=1810916 RepID=UPI003CCD9183
MVQIKAFEVEQWMDTHETWATHNLAETCCASISLDDLVDFSNSTTAKTDLIDYTQKQVYGAIRGSSALRSRIADRYESIADTDDVSEDKVLITNGAIQANFLALYTQLGPGDHVICHYPTYQQLYSVPESLGAEVSLWKAREESGFSLDVEELRGLVRGHTRMIILNNPQNPTGAVLHRDALQAVVDIARELNITIHSDEVYRPLFHSLPAGQGPPPSILDFGYENAVATGSLHKAFSLAGIRVGWIASRSKEIIERCASCRDYTTISVSQIDDRIASFALSSPTVENLMERNIELARKNLALLEDFVREFEGTVSWVKPQGGTTAFLKFRTHKGEPIDDEEFCKRLQEKVGVMFVPGRRCFGDRVDYSGYVRVGFVPEHQVMVDGLKALRAFMASGYGNVPAAV